MTVPRPQFMQMDQRVRVLVNILTRSLFVHQTSGGLSPTTSLGAEFVGLLEEFRTFQAGDVDKVEQNEAQVWQELNARIFHVFVAPQYDLFLDLFVSCGQWEWAVRLLEKFVHKCLDMIQKSKQIHFWMIPLFVGLVFTFMFTVLFVWVVEALGDNYGYFRLDMTNLMMMIFPEDAKSLRSVWKEDCQDRKRMELLPAVPSL